MAAIPGVANRHQCNTAMLLSWYAATRLKQRTEILHPPLHHIPQCFPVWIISLALLNVLGLHVGLHQCKHYIFQHPTNHPCEPVSICWHTCKHIVESSVCCYLSCEQMAARFSLLCGMSSGLMLIRCCFGFARQHATTIQQMPRMSHDQPYGTPKYLSMINTHDSQWCRQTPRILPSDNRQMHPINTSSTQCEDIQFMIFHAEAIHEATTHVIAPQAHYRDSHDAKSSVRSLAFLSFIRTLPGRRPSVRRSLSRPAASLEKYAESCARPPAAPLTSHLADSGHRPEPNGLCIDKR